MLNFRKLRQDFSPAILREGKELFDKGVVLQVKILKLDGDSLKMAARVRGAYENVYESEIEIDRHESIAIDSNCDCPCTFDCAHIAASLFHLEPHLNEILVAYAQETDLEECEEIDDRVKAELKETFASAATKEEVRRDRAYQREMLSEYIAAASVLGGCSYFHSPLVHEEMRAELCLIAHVRPLEKNQIELQFVLRLPFRSKPLMVPHAKAFIDALFYREEIFLAGRKLFFTTRSFGEETRQILELIIPYLRFSTGEDRLARHALVDLSAFGLVLEHAFDLSIAKGSHIGEKEPQPLPALYMGSLEEPLLFSAYPCGIEVDIDYLEAPGATFLLKPAILIEEESAALSETLSFESTRPGLIYKNVYFRFHPKIKRRHLRELAQLSDLAIPEPLFGSFMENALPVMREYSVVRLPGEVKQITTLPFTGKLSGRCDMNYIAGELDCELIFLYDGIEVPVAQSKLTYEHIAHFVSQEGILARHLVEERALLEALFEGFLYDEKEGVYRCKSEKKIVEFMTEVIPKHQQQVQFNCPQNLADQFLYDDTTFELELRESDRVDLFEIDFKIAGPLKGVSIDLLWECVGSKKGFLEIESPGREKKAKTRMPKILVLDLEKISALLHHMDEIGIKKLENHIEKRPLWSLTTIHPGQFQNLPVRFTISKALLAIQKQILGETTVKSSALPEAVEASFRNYQVEGVHWLERLRRMHLNGILADDMGLGKTLQAITALTQAKVEHPEGVSLVVCPTSLVYNWRAELHKFNPKMVVRVIDGPPNMRRKLLKELGEVDVFITSYNLLQKDIEIYKNMQFDYLILDEGQYIKNRTTRNAKSVKQMVAKHRLILTGTPIENSLEELWSLFDFLMPGLLSTYDRYVEKYIRGTVGSLEVLKRKVSPFILRRMKEDVLDDLPPVSEIRYHCHLTDKQKELYHSYAASAKEELTRLVKKEGFDKIQIHVLATLTRLKQICCHPAIFAKESVEQGDSAKYDMLMELVPNLLESKHKTVIFSQYTKMLGIMKEDLTSRGIPFAYLDGSTKNRLDIVNEFNERQDIPIFLVSLKAGGSGLNLVGADTVIHYDMWWNPAVENQALDRVHRIGQKKSVSSYKLITLNTIEEKIEQLHNKKRGLVKKLISSDEEAIAKLTWEEVLELLQT